MPRTFADSLAQDLTSTFFNTNEFAEKVTIARAGQSTANVPAIVEAREYELDDASGDRSFNNNLKTGWQSWDFDIVPSEYKINSVAVDPQKGDRITRSNGLVYVVEPIPKKNCFEPVEGDGRIIRLHTKRVS